MTSPMTDLDKAVERLRTWLDADDPTHWGQHENDIDALLTDHARLSADLAAALPTPHSDDTLADTAKDALKANAIARQPSEKPMTDTPDLDGLSLDVAARALFSVQCPRDDFDNLTDLAQMAWLRRAHEALIALARRAVGGGGEPTDAVIERVARAIAVGCNLDPDATSPKAALAGHTIPEWMFFRDAAFHALTAIRSPE